MSSAAKLLPGMGGGTMRSMVEGAQRWSGGEVGPLHRTSCGPPPRPGEEQR